MNIKETSKFFREVKAEARKVVWPTRKETLVTSAMVFIFVLLMSIFFLGVDQIFSVLVKFIFGIAG